MRKSLLTLSFLTIATPLVYSAVPVLSLPMETDGRSRVKELISNKNINVYGKHTNENVKGAVGNAMRFDGYSTYVQGAIGDYTPAASSSFSVWVAPETYPIIRHDEPTSQRATIAGTLDSDKKQGWRFAIDKAGTVAFECFTGGNLTTVASRTSLPRYEWSHLVAVNDTEAKKLYLYCNGELLSEAISYGPVDNASNMLVVGKDNSPATGHYQLDAFNGIIDELTVYDGVLPEADLIAAPENPADLSIPSSRFERDLLRPKYHGMPAANWTNESHGMTYSDGRYHVFFQKNANGPYMSRLHWGHISSENLYDWTEERIAIAPGESYDTKGCWSGCVFTDDEITGSLPNIIYTGVDYAKAYIVQASPKDESLIDWDKNGVIINGRPAGLSDDFRDPYFFRNGDDAYIIVGTAKNGIGATTLHKYDGATKTWSNNGDIFFAGSSVDDHGTFWEMPNVTRMPNGKWLFTVTPQATSSGVHTLCWVGEINSDGTFSPDSESFTGLELISRQGFGLLSPTIYQHDETTILLGIVPDKLPESENCDLGWAHLYSFPREISLDENNNLVQQPYSGLKELRTDAFEERVLTLDGTKTLTGISGRQIEAKGVFKVGNVPFGFNLFKNSKGKAVVTYTPSTNRLEVNLTGLNRKVNDNNVYNGIYSCTLPEKPEPGSELSLDIWVDGSIMDIFVNDRWATSIRVYPTDSDADGVEVFSLNGPVEISNLYGWNLSAAGGDNSGDDDGPDAGIEEILPDLPEFVNVYGINGVMIKRNVPAAEALTGLSKGIYLVNDRKVIL